MRQSKDPLVECFDPFALAAGKKLDHRSDAPKLVSHLDPFDLKALAASLPDGHRHPLAANRNARTGPPGAIPAPAPAAKQSRTMQYALQPAKTNTPTKPTLAPRTPARLDADSIVSPKVVPKTPLSPVNGPTQPVTPWRSRTVSAPVTSSPGKGTAQCNGVTKAGKRCARQVKLPATHTHLDPIPVLYCHQHKDTPLSQSGFYVRKPESAEKFVEFSDYIPEYLQIDTQLALRVEMEKATSHADGPGFIYTFEIRDTKRTDVIQLKVGRAVKLGQRLDQWDKQCPSKEQIPRGWWPETAKDNDGTPRSLLKGNIQPGNPGPFCHRVERLVHIELADLSLHTPYLRGWPKATLEPTPSVGSTGSFRKSTTAEDKCPDCGKIHQEIFAFPRPVAGEYKGREWESIVKPVIEKWGRFVKEYYG